MWNVQQDYGVHVLWIEGRAGSGKSVLSSFLSSVLEQKLATEKVVRPSCVAYFFCHDTDKRLRTAHGVLASWVDQLLRQDPRFLVHFSRELAIDSRQESTTWTFSILWRVFERIMADPSAGDIWLLLDAFGMTIQRL